MKYADAVSLTEGILGVNGLPGVIILDYIGTYRADGTAFQYITGVIFIAGSGSIHITDGFKGDFCFSYALVGTIGICNINRQGGALPLPSPLAGTVVKLSSTVWSLMSGPGIPVVDSRYK